MFTTVLLIVAAGGGVLILALGLWAEHRARTRRPASPIRPIQPLPPAPVQRRRRGLANHPDPLFAAFKTALWLASLFVLADHLSDTQQSTVAYIVWGITIVPHEAGHLFCQPFGWVLHVAGGSIWQLLPFVLVAIYAFGFRRMINAALFFWTLVGHSLINLSVYIEDAAERELPLIFGMSKDHHDWWNLLKHYDALEHDNLIAGIAYNGGALIVIAAALAGVLFAWWLPRAWMDTRPADLAPPRADRDLDALLDRES